MARFSRVRVSRKVVIMVAGGILLVALGYVLPHVTSPGMPSDEAAYEKWVSQFGSGLGDRPAVVILEPDALAQLDSCLNGAQQQERLQMLSYAVKTLQTSNDQVYLDAGHSNWIPAAQMATRLKAADVAGAYGFALNVSNFDPTSQEIVYANALNQNLGMTKRFVIDTSRNGTSGAAPRAHRAVGSISGALPGVAGGALAGQLYTDPDTQAADWVRTHPGDPRSKEIEQEIANQPTAMWFGAWSGNITTAVASFTSAASLAHKVPILVTYDIPQLNCGGTSNNDEGSWCNPPGHQLGAAPQVLDNRGDMGLWIKAPGESDGNCGLGAGTAAGDFSPSLAQDLINGGS